MTPEELPEPSPPIEPSFEAAADADGIAVTFAAKSRPCLKVVSKERSRWTSIRRQG